MAGRLEAPHAWQSASRHWGDWADSSQASQAGNSARLTDRSEPACRPHVPAPSRSGATQRRLRGGRRRARARSRARRTPRRARGSRRGRCPRRRTGSRSRRATRRRRPPVGTRPRRRSAARRRRPYAGTRPHDAGYCEARGVARGKLRRCEGGEPGTGLQTRAATGRGGAASRARGGGWHRPRRNGLDELEALIGREGGRSMSSRSPDEGRVPRRTVGLSNILVARPRRWVWRSRPPLHCGREPRGRGGAERW